MIPDLRKVSDAATVTYISNLTYPSLFAPTFSSFSFLRQLGQDG